MNKRVGRPVKPAPESGRVALSLRVTAPMKAALEEEATKNGRSLSQEAEMRLEQSFTLRETAISLFEALLRFEREREQVGAPEAHLENMKAGLRKRKK
jgi:hypothetical protein